jgi:hypothetical protein
MAGRRRRALLAAAGSLFLLGSCNPTLQTTVENGIINLSTALLTSFFRALTELGQEANSASARLMSDALAALA